MHSFDQGPNLNHQMDQLRAHIWWIAGEQFQKLFIKICTLILPIWIGGCCHQLRECVAKISAHYYLLVVPLVNYTIS